MCNLQKIYIYINCFTEIIERKNKLDGLLPLLKAVVNATKPLQEYLNIPNDKVRDEHVLAKLLPDPLYIFYANAVAYKNVYGKHFFFFCTFSVIQYLFFSQMHK